VTALPLFPDNYACPTCQGQGDIPAQLGVAKYDPEHAQIPY
jgi:hypothetical protein